MDNYSRERHSGDIQNMQAGQQPSVNSHRQESSQLSSEIADNNTSKKNSTGGFEAKNAAGSKSGLTGFKEQLKEKLFEPKPGVSPTRQKVMVVLVPVLFVVLAVIVFQFVIPPASPAHTVEPTGSDSKPEISSLSWDRPEPWPADLRDPMRPLEAVKAEAADADEAADTVEVISEDIEVTGIVYSSDRPSVIINGEVVYVGDEISGARVLSIRSDSVEFEADGNKWLYKVEK